MDFTFGFSIGEHVVVHDTARGRDGTGIVVGFTGPMPRGVRVIEGIVVSLDGRDLCLQPAFVLHDTPATRSWIAAAVPDQDTIGIEARRLFWDLHADNLHLAPNVSPLPRP